MSQPARKLREHEWRYPPTSTRAERHTPWLSHVESTDKDFEVPFSAVLEQALKARPSVAIDPNVLGGTPHIAGTRIPVFMILDAVEYHGALSGALKSYPQLTLEQIKDAVSFAAAVLEHPLDYETESPAR